MYSLLVDHKVVLLFFKKEKKSAQLVLNFEGTFFMRSNIMDLKS